MTDREKILDYLKNTSSTLWPAYRKTLSILTELDDRQVREIISDLQLSGEPIFVVGKGYFYAGHGEHDLAAASKYISTEYKRARSLKRKMDKIYNCFKKRFNRIIPGLEEQPNLL